MQMLASARSECEMCERARTFIRVLWQLNDLSEY